MKKIISSALFLGLALGVTSSVSAQNGNTQNSAPNAQEKTGRKDRMGKMRGGKHGMMGGLNRLNLTDAQKKQLETLRQNNQPSETVRAEMRQLMDAQRSNTLTDAQRARLNTLREQNKANAEKMQQQVLVILTPEQRTRLQEMKQGRKDEMGGGDGDGMRRRNRGENRGMKDGGGMRGGLQNLNLTDAQKEQLRSLRANNSNDAARQEMRQLMQTKRGGETLTADQEARLKTLREQAKAEGEKRHQQVLAILTPQQREQLEKNKAERKERKKDGRQNNRMQNPSQIN